MGHLITGKLAYDMGCQRNYTIGWVNFSQKFSNNTTISNGWYHAQYCSPSQTLPLIIILIALGIAIWLLIKKDNDIKPDKTPKKKVTIFSTLKHRLTIMGIYGPSASLHIARERLSRGNRFKECFGIIEPFVKDKYGLEIGGPTPMFYGGHQYTLPIYQVAEKIDDSNFGNSTVWNNDSRIKGDSGAFGRGIRITCDGTDLNPILNESYDFLLSCHSIEHMANPLKALYEWKRVLKDEGIMILIAPHIKGTIDHKRRLTTLEHIVEDYKQNTDEKDMTHLDEIIDKTDKRIGWLESGDFQSYIAQAHENYKHRILHHHTFTPASMIRLVDEAGFLIKYVDVLATINIVIVACKPKPGEDMMEIHKANMLFLLPSEDWRKHSPFKIDKV